MNSEWRTDTPEKDGNYLVAIYDEESSIHFISTGLNHDGEWLCGYPYKITGWMELPALPKLPENIVNG